MQNQYVGDIGDFAKYGLLRDLWRLGHWQAFFAPQAFDFLVIDVPALDMQECGYLAVPIPTILSGQANDGKPQGILIVSLSPECKALGAAGLIENLAGATFTAAKALANMDYWITFLFRA